MPQPRIGTSHGGLRNFGCDQPRIASPPLPKLELLMEGFLWWTGAWTLPLYPPRIPSCWSCCFVYRSQDLSVAKIVLGMLTCCPYWWANRYHYFLLLHDDTPTHAACWYSCPKLLHGDTCSMVPLTHSYMIKLWILFVLLCTWRQDALRSAQQGLFPLYFRWGKLNPCLINIATRFTSGLFE